ncbi:MULTISPECIES: HD domain-containing protein [unclassified Sphingobium]|uniref:HD domain-containing protein n=1 Tax=unclassified Sphingobium TaxID=2611147 RepID=UPI0022250518|nr:MULTISPECIES: HD domain-containing protein [unclassified Sphingobium]MCW2413452.1 HD superfamily phosphohydrolase [Sphingobium sp. B8D3D]MCW2414249.1 HD superfamily phosphohydrolase [Sphingobium sp. B8D3A]
MAETPIRSALRDAVPTLASQIDALCADWLGNLRTSLDEAPQRFRPKQLNDPIWGTIELQPREVALLDSRLLQRMRGVRQLGLAQLVFPGAAHDRLEHIVGVVGAVDRMADSLERQVARRNAEFKRDQSGEMIPGVDEDERATLRLAAMFHDLGHGPFSHALEPVLEVTSPLATASEDGGEWRRELRSASSLLTARYSLNSRPAASEVIAVMIVVSEAVTELLRSGGFRLGNLDATDVQERIIACIIGGVAGPGVTHLSTVISGQVDADRLDFLQRDAHHSGLEIGFDTERLLSKLEILQIRDSNLESADLAMRQRIAAARNNVVHQVGIAASGYGSFEQMLIGRTFLYDRLYHHHKVRAAEAMAQRMLLVAERDRERRFDLSEIFLNVGDDTFLRIVAGEVTHPKLAISSVSAAALARGILDRNLLHRAFAFRGRFIATPPGLGAESADANRDAQWKEVVKRLDGLQARYELGAEIHALATDIATVLLKAGIDVDELSPVMAALEDTGPEQIIVDLPGRKAGAIRILARYPDGSLKLPEFSFNPQKWADAYDLQKRTGYVFCAREVLPVVALASRIAFLRHFGVVMAKDADAYIKAGQTIEASWLEGLIKAELIDADTAELLTCERHSLLRVRAEDLGVPDAWLGEDPDFASAIAGQLNRHLKGGLMAAGREALTKTMESLWRFVDIWYAGSRTTSELANEAELQKLLVEHLRATLQVDEGTEIAGGELDLLVEKQVLIENKFHASPANPDKVGRGAGAQGRRYGLALPSQLVVVAAARRMTVNGTVPAKTKAISVRPVSTENDNRVEIRIDLPFGAKLPSQETGEHVS